jgi:hypothetical protein
MRTLGTRRAALVAGAAAVAAVALAGCSAGQVAETSVKRPSNMGVNVGNSDNSVLIRNLAVTYNGVQGYPAGGSAPLQLSLINRTTAEITVLISSQPPKTPDPTIVSGSSVGLVGGTDTTPSTAIPEPSGSRDAAVPQSSAGSPGTVEQPSVQPTPEPSASVAPAGEAQPARITLGPMEAVTFLPGGKQTLQVMGLTGDLRPGSSVNLVFEFSNGVPALTVPASVGIPLSPAPRPSGVPSELSEVSED